jgi:hypothetical protein
MAPEVLPMVRQGEQYPYAIIRANDSASAQPMRRSLLFKGLSAAERAVERLHAESFLRRENWQVSVIS